ncbi:toll-like receptor 7 [Lingula anatina]|uniref:Toll-like receptor 7 n=1 Tax=Lingula anatina TaxID=7574 RepID=A0A1S3GYQ4_LINAN|nr:toll-like receptor 7 [Lingula anatina]|eukprot:XP_013379005.1 toll-like receptor 7 [Lingula anatina]
MTIKEISTMPRKGYIRLYLWCLMNIILSIGGYKAHRCPEPCRCDFTSLSQGIVNCSYSPLRALPLDIPIPRNTTVLDLRYTGLYEIPPNALSHLENLKALYVGGNNIKHFHEENFAGLWNLEHLDLSPLHPDTNFDHATFPVRLFHDLTQLRVLIFGKMSVTMQVQQGYLDRTLAPLHRLQQVFFPGLPWRNLAFGPGYSNLTSLKTVVFHGHGSEVPVHLRKQSFAMLKNCPIERLAFIRSGLDAVEYGTMSSFPHLKTLDIEEASFISFREVEKFICDLNNTSIEALRMNSIFSRRNGEFEDKTWILSANTFRCLKSTSLKSLELLRDNIMKIDIQNFDFLIHLEYLDLSGNDVLRFLENDTQPSGWDTVYYKALSLSNLTLLRMDYNVYKTIMVNVEDVPSNSFWYGRPQLPLGPSKFQNSLQKTQQGPLPNLNPEEPILKVRLPENVEFWSTSWWAFGVNRFLRCDTLKGSVYFFPNKLRYLRIVDLNLNLNKFCPVMYGLDRLEFLDFSFNGFHFLHKHFFNTFISLVYLYAKENNLGPLIAEGGLHPIQLPNLEILDLSVNKISTIPKDFFGYLASLKRLDLSDNRISTLSFTMGNLLSIEYIGISTNQLTDFSTSELDYIRKMNARSFNVTLNVSNNPMDCTICDARGFLRWIIHSNFTIIFSNNSTCYVNGPKTSSERRLRRLERECESVTSSNQWLTFGVSLGVISAMACGLVVAFIYRWNIRFHVLLRHRHFRKRGFITAKHEDDNDKY